VGQGDGGIAPLTTVLLSGGLDSAVALGLAVKDTRWPTSALHVNYGQAAAASEARAAREIAKHFDTPLSTVTVGGLRFGEGEIVGRNLALLSLAMMANMGRGGTIVIGIHSGSGYIDCSQEFIDQFAALSDLLTNGSVVVSAPFAGLAKADISALAKDMSLPVDQTYSCERGDVPCMNCASCLDVRSCVST
jgi:7-cyano-7-deazaguanine synthase